MPYDYQVELREAFQAETVMAPHRISVFSDRGI